MSLQSKWTDLIQGQTDETFEEFWEEYSKAEINIYTDILENGTGILSGNFKELSEKYNVRPIIFMGFLDGINSSLNKTLELDNITEDSLIELDIDFRLLYLNMLKVPAEHLYSLEGWNKIFNDDEKNEIIKEYKASKTVVKSPKIGRNEPCPCGSTKKYKHCCGK